MKRIVFVIIIGFLFVFSGCNNDEGYSLNDVWIGFGIVENIDSYKIVMDDGEVLYPVAFEAQNPWYDYNYSGNNREIKEGDRVLVNFTVLYDKLDDKGKIVAYYVKVNSAKKILKKGILEITEENKDSIGNDPIIVKECWIANDLLNFQLKYWGRNEIHFINLVKQPGVLNAAGQPFELELRHNNNGDSEEIPYIAYVSFRLESLKVAGIDSVQFKVKSTDYDGKLTEFNKVYKY